MKVFFTGIISFFTASFSLAQVICIDPGHGYGTNGENLDSRTWEEITTNCAVGLLLEDTLTKQGYSVIMTRTTSDSGSWMSLTQRAELADSYDSERLLSIHCNGGGGTGTETFWCYRASPNRAIDSIFSQLVQESMVYYGEWRNRRSIEDDLYLGFHLGVLKGAAPGCLNEIGFVDTPTDLEKLLKDDWRIKFAIAYSEAINESFEVDYPSSVSQEKSEIAVYPNPFTDYLVISNNSITDNAVFRLLDTSGRTIIGNTDFTRTADGNIIANVPGIMPGLYIVEIRNKNWNYALPVLKLTN
jgi:N-acetylmuramoyl-L-alanine amidase